jgi:hypothetical protein
MDLVNRKDRSLESVASPKGKTGMKRFAWLLSLSLMALLCALPGAARASSQISSEVSSQDLPQFRFAQAYAAALFFSGFLDPFYGLPRYRDRSAPPGFAPFYWSPSFWLFGDNSGSNLGDDVRLSARDVGSGVSGAAALEGFNVWSSIAYTGFDDNLATTRMEGHAISGFIGIDKQFAERLTGGLSVGRDDTQVTTLFNSGNTSSEGITVVPYLAYAFAPIWNLDSLSANVSVGYSKIDVDTERQLLGGGVVLGDTTTTRKFGAINVSASKWFGVVNLTGNVGYLRSHDATDAYRESFSISATNAVVGGAVIPSNKSDLGQFRFGVKASYWTRWAQPYVLATYELDQTHPDVSTASPNLPQPANDKDGFVVGGGLLLSFAPWISGSFEATTVQDRSHFDSWTASGNLRIAL